MFFSAQKCNNSECKEKEESWEHRFYHHPIKPGDEMIPREHVEKLAEDNYQRVISPYEHSVQEATKKWKERSSTLSYSYQILDLECRIACTFYGVVKMVPFTRLDMPNGWEPGPWAFDGAERSAELEKQKENCWYREADLLFWPRFFHTAQNSVPCDQLCEALLFHLLLVEGASLHQETFRRAFRSLIGCPWDGMVGMLQWKWFISRFGPTLKDIYTRMKGACLADGSPAPWLQYESTNDMCNAILAETVVEMKEEIKANRGSEGEDEGDEGEEKQPEPESEPAPVPKPPTSLLTKGLKKPKFIMRLGRMKDHFSLHYVKTTLDDDDNLADAAVALPCNIEHSIEGYWADKGGASKFKTLRELLILYVCQRNHMPDELKRLNEESHAWQHHARRYEDPCDPTETMAALMNFLKFKPDGFQRLMSAFVQAVDSKDDDMFEPIFKFLDHDKSSQLDSEEVQTGVLMLLEPALTCSIDEYSFNFTEGDLLRWLPSASAVDIDKKRFKEVLAESVGKMYTEAKEKVSLADEDDRLMEGFLKNIFAKFEDVALDCNLVKNLRVNDDALDDEKSFVAFAKRLLLTYAFFPIWLTRSLIWATHDSKKELNLRRIVWIFSLCLASIFICGLSAFLYYVPIATVILYHKYSRVLDTDNSRPHVSILEAYIPLVGNIVAGLVLAVGNAVQDNQRTRQAEEQWLNAQLHVRQGRVNPVSLKLSAIEKQKELSARRQAADSNARRDGRLEDVVEIQPRAFDGIAFLHGKHNPVREVNAQVPRRKAPSFLRTVVSYYKRRRRLTTYVFLIFAGFISVAHSLLPGVYREGEGNGSAKAWLQPKAFNVTGSTKVAEVELVISLMYIICSLPAVFFLGVLLQGAILHYYDLRSILGHIIDVTNPRAANVHDYDYFLPLNQVVNVEFWILLREAAKRKVDPSVNTVVAAALVLYLLLIGCTFIRVVVLKAPIFDLFNTIALYDIIALSIYLLQLFLVLASLNTKVAVSTLECLENAKFAIATEINKIRQLLTKEQEKSREAHVLLEHKRLQNRKHAYALEEAKPKELEYQSLLTGLQDNYTILDSALSSMRVVDTPITVLGITVDWAFLAKMVGILAAGVGPTLFNALDTLGPNNNSTSTTLS